MTIPGEDRARAEAAGEGAEAVVDEILPAEVDWRTLVRRYPVITLGLATLGGFLLGRSHGREIVRGVSGYAAGEVERNLRAVLGDEGV